MFLVNNHFPETWLSKNEHPELDIKNTKGGDVRLKIVELIQELPADVLVDLLYGPNQLPEYRQNFWHMLEMIILETMPEKEETSYFINQLGHSSLWKRWIPLSIRLEVLLRVRLIYPGLQNLYISTGKDVSKEEPTSIEDQITSISSIAFTQRFAEMSPEIRAEELNFMLDTVGRERLATKKMVTLLSNEAQRGAVVTIGEKSLVYIAHLCRITRAKLLNVSTNTLPNEPTLLEETIQEIRGMTFPTISVNPHQEMQFLHREVQRGGYRNFGQAAILARDLVVKIRNREEAKTVFPYVMPKLERWLFQDREPEKMPMPQCNYVNDIRDQNAQQWDINEKLEKIKFTTENPNIDGMNAILELMQESEIAHIVIALFCTEKTTRSKFIKNILRMFTLMGIREMEDFEFPAWQKAFQLQSNDTFVNPRIMTCAYAMLANLQSSLVIGNKVSIPTNDPNQQTIERKRYKEILRSYHPQCIAVWMEHQKNAPGLLHEFMQTLSESEDSHFTEDDLMLSLNGETTNLRSLHLYLSDSEKIGTLQSGLDERTKHTPIHPSRISKEMYDSLCGNFSSIVPTAIFQTFYSGLTWDQLACIDNELALALPPSKFLHIKGGGLRERKAEMKFILETMRPFDRDHSRHAKKVADILNMEIQISHIAPRQLSTAQQVGRKDTDAYEQEIGLRLNKELKEQMGIRFLGPYEAYDLTAEECKQSALKPFAPRGMVESPHYPKSPSIAYKRKGGNNRNTESESDRLVETMVLPENISDRYRRAMRKIYETDEQISGEELVEEENWLHELYEGEDAPDELDEEDIEILKIKTPNPHITPKQSSAAQDVGGMRMPMNKK